MHVLSHPPIDGGSNPLARGRVAAWGRTLNQELHANGRRLLLQIYLEEQDFSIAFHRRVQVKGRWVERRRKRRPVRDHQSRIGTLLRGIALRSMPSQTLRRRFPSSMNSTELDGNRIRWPWLFRLRLPNLAQEVETKCDGREAYWTALDDVGPWRTTDVEFDDTGGLPRRRSHRHDALMRMPWNRSNADQLDLVDESDAGACEPELPDAAEHVGARTPLQGLSVDTRGTEGTPLLIPVDCLEEDPANPRTEFPEAEIDELAQDIALRGILQPIVARRRTDDGHYRVLFGAKRLRAARRAGLEAVPVVHRRRGA